MDDRYEVLVVGGDTESRSELIHLLEDIYFNVTSCSTLEEAVDVFEMRPFALVFCDEQLSDGTFREFLRARNTLSEQPRVVVILHEGNWDEYLEAITLGAFDAIRRPLVPADVELVVLHAMHNSNQRLFQNVAM